MARKYIIVDSQGNALAHGVGGQVPGSRVWSLQVDEKAADRVMEQAQVALMGKSESTPGMEARVLRREKNEIYLEPIRPLSEDARLNLRVPVRFSSYLYPISGGWKGREPIVSRDLSCGGVAFCCARGLETGEIVEVVVPVTAQPLVVRLKILRAQPAQDGEFFYAGCFVELVREEENMIREAVFSLQIRNNE